jgi:(1->4)-alpha-D-glucan 1-alpha-D-glucosylmutase
MRGDLLDLLADSLCGRYHGEGLELAARVQQLSPAVMAKGKEDTALYRWNRLLALNEVGGDPDCFGIEVGAFHAACAAWVLRGDRGLRATSTHDTKRSEDVRARLCVLSEIPDRWADAVRRWSAGSAAYRRAEVDPDIEYVLYQTLVGAHPIDAGRLTAYMEKATREAAVHTTWTRPDAAYDAAVRDFTVGVLEDAALMSDVAAFVEPLAAWGRRVSLAWTLLTLTVPGVPDIYQGTELWDLSLVDPDNRRPVDFGRRRELLARIDDGWLPPIDDTGAAKLLITSRTMRLRRQRPEIFTSYRPVFAEGRVGEHALAFDRGGVVALATRLPVGLSRHGGWRDTVLSLDGHSWTEVFTNTSYGGNRLAVAELLHAYPVALLVKEQ